MKYTHVYIIFLISIFHTFCRQRQAALQKKDIKSETKDLAASSGFNERNIYTNYEYTDSIGKSLVIQNGFPRGGTKYIAPTGETYFYAIFWTRIVNETDNALELKFEFPLNSYEIPSLPGKFYELMVPPDTMTLDKFPLYNYGLTDLKSFLDASIHKPSSLKRTIHSEESSGFYVVVLSLAEGAHGTMRTGLSLKERSLIYRINIDGSKSHTQSKDMETNCGSINLLQLLPPTPSLFLQR